MEIKTYQQWMDSEARDFDGFVKPGEVCDCKATPAQAKQAKPKDKQQGKTKRKDLPKRRASAV